MPLILVVDDTALAREAVARLLKYEGFQTVSASNGKEAYATLYSQKPDLIVLDLMMPEMDGITFLRMIRQNPRWEDIPILVLTGLEEDDLLVSRAKELGVNDLVPKATFGYDDLLGRIRKAVGTKVTARN